MSRPALPAFALLIAFVCLLGASQVLPGALADYHDQAATPAATTDDVEATARQFIDAFNQAISTGDTSGIDATVAPDYVDHTAGASSGGPIAAGREELKETMLFFHEMLPDGVLTVEDVIVEGDQAAVRFSFSVTLNPANFGLSGSPQSVTAGGVAILRIVDGQVVESWDYDELSEIASSLAMGTPETATPVP